MKGGMFRIYSASDAASYPVIKLAEQNDAKQWISDVKFSGDGRTVAVGKNKLSKSFISSCLSWMKNFSKGKNAVQTNRIRSENYEKVTQSSFFFVYFLSTLSSLWQSFIFSKLFSICS